MSLLNDKMAKFEIIKQKQDELISNRQQLRLSELSQPKYIGGYSSFSKANSPKNSAKASVGTFGSSEKTTASTLSPTMYKNNNDINNSNKFTSSPATPIVKRQPRRRTVTLQELEKIQNLVGIDPANIQKRENTKARVAMKLNASRRASSYTRKVNATPTVNKDTSNKNRFNGSVSEKKASNFKNNFTDSIKTTTSLKKAIDEKVRLLDALQLV